MTLTWSGVWARVIIIAAVATAVLSVAGIAGPVRPAVTLFFALTCPGMSLVRLLKLRDPLTELTIGIAASVAIAGLVGGVLLYFGLWTPEGGLVILIAVALAGLTGERAATQLREFLSRRQSGSAGDPITPPSERSRQSEPDSLDL